jgi:hypothetical protein
MVRLKKKNLVDDEKEVTSLNPKKLISRFYNKVDLGTAAILIFVSILLETLILFFLKMPNILEYFTIRILINFIVSWVVFGAILYAILYFVKGKNNLKGNEFKKILSGLASFRVVAIFALIIVIAISLIFMPKILPYMSMILQNPAFFVSNGYMPALGIGAGIGILLLIIFALSLFVYYLIMMYHFVDNMYKFENPVSTVIMTIIVIFIMGLLASFI